MPDAPDTSAGDRPNPVPAPASWTDLTTPILDDISKDDAAEPDDAGIEHTHTSEQVDAENGS